MTVKGLRTVLEQHAAWVRGKGGARADLREDLREADLSEADLGEADLSEADLREAPGDGGGQPEGGRLPGDPVSPRYLLDAPDPRRKTRTWTVATRDGGTVLGAIFWYGPWRCYSFTPTTERETVYERQCLRDIADFCEARTRDHRRERAIAAAEGK